MEIKKGRNKRGIIIACLLIGAMLLKGCGILDEGTDEGTSGAASSINADEEASDHAASASESTSDENNSAPISDEEAIASYIASLGYSSLAGRQGTGRFGFLVMGDDMIHPYVTEYTFEKGSLAASYSDYDGDGTPELLLITLEGTKLENDETSYVPYGMNDVKLHIFEATKDENKGLIFEKKDEYRVGLQNPNDMEYTFFEKQLEDGIHIYLESKNNAYFADGLSWNIMEFIYNGNNFEFINNDFVYNGSDYSGIDLNARHAELKAKLGIDDFQLTDTLLMDQIECKKLLKIECSSFLTDDQFRMFESYGTGEIDGTEIRFHDYTSAEEQTFHDFDTFFKENPIDFMYALADTNEDLKRSYQSDWDREITNAYERLKTLGDDDDKSAAAAEASKWSGEKEDILKKKAEEEVKAYTSVTDGEHTPETQAEIENEARYLALKDKARELIGHIYDIEGSYTYVYQLPTHESYDAQRGYAHASRTVMP